MNTTPETELDNAFAQSIQATKAGSENGTDEGTVRPRLPGEDVQGISARQDEIGVRKRHAAFHRFGRLLEGRDAIPPGPYSSASLWARRDLSHARCDYPCCFTEHGDDEFVVPLRVLIDALIEKSDADGTESTQTRSYAHELESQVRAILHENSGESLGAAIERAVDRVFSGSPETNGQQAALRNSLSQIADRLDSGLSPLDCTAEAPLELFIAAAKWSWRKRSASCAGELDSLRASIEQMLRTDERESAEAHDPERLESALGTEEIDAQAMAAIVSTGHLEHSIPEPRRERLRQTLSMLNELRSLWSPDTTDSGPFDRNELATACGEAMEQLRSRRAKWTGFFKFVWIARLEVKNRYNTDAHDAFFEAFAWENLEDEERALMPPVLVALDDDALRRESTETLYEVVNSGSPVKVLVEVRDLFSQTRKWHPPAAAALAIAAAATGTAYVLQAPVSHVNVIAKRLPGAFSWPGSALICVYKGADNLEADRRFLHTAAAAEARLWPVIVFDPAAGAQRADRMNLGYNTAPELDWPVKPFDCEDAAGTPAAFDLPFTVADFLLDSLHSEELFMAVPPEEWHDRLRPIHEYLDLSQEDAQACVPFVWAVDADGGIAKLIVSHEIEEATRHWREIWRNVRETAGVHNPDAEHALAGTQSGQEEIAAIEKRYQAKLDAQVGELTQTIVSRIAARLLGGEADLSNAPAPGAFASTPAPAHAVETDRTGTELPAEDAGGVEDEPPTFDEPYIDTPLCTSCNECTQLNNLIFDYNEDKQAYIKDASAGTYRDLVIAAEKCPVHIIHPGTPKNPSEPGFHELQKRAAPFL